MPCIMPSSLAVSGKAWPGSTSQVEAGLTSEGCKQCFIQGAEGIDIACQPREDVSGVLVVGENEDNGSA